jgi:hypothetical protein
MKKLINVTILLAFALLVAGCGGSANKDDLTALETQLQEKEQELQAKTSEISQLEATVKQNQDEIERLEKAVMSAQEAREAAYSDMDRVKTADTASGGDLLPPAQVGECYARVFVPATYESMTERILVKEASEEVEIIPAAYEWVEERVLVKDASTRLEEVPAQYEWVEEKILIREAHTEWKKGRGLIEKVDDTTGEIMCLVEVPAEYKTVKKRVMKSGPSTRTVEVPAVYETVKVKRLVKPAEEKRIQIPAEYSEVTKWRKTSEGHMAWKPVLCETNMTRTSISKIQVALRDSGHNPGPIDGIIGPQTSAAIRSFQKAKGLSVGGLTYETIEKLGVKLGS